MANAGGYHLPKNILSAKSAALKCRRSAKKRYMTSWSIHLRNTISAVISFTHTNARTAARCRKQGKYTGRKPIEIDWTRFGQFYGEWKSKNITGRDFMRRRGLSANTFYRRVREYEAEHGIAEPTFA